MEITGRIVKDASVFKLKENREVVNFTIAINDSYKPKDSTELKKITTYINCSYWVSSKSAKWLKKGALVELFGRIGLNVYIGSDSEAHGALTFHTSHIKILAFAKDREQTPEVRKGAKASSEKEPDDLPF
ncbi:single-stranded DNA-binding protein [Flavobacterium pectinovorum]|uniref:Single-stranded DNA-binding protein n=1 Tax=Flavobacterium pectinovorum TaxID=29533 RepID=A0A502EMZ7_9FLAO|nr:single-stranded DNA-binding protein [Flavobacterium pectinovorum]TPG38392.1 single-stranded DNA-binding protein [Flavobacterium pectinovorum]